MSRKISDAVANIARPVKVNEDKLEALRQVVREHRDITAHLEYLEAEVKAARKKKWEIEFKKLPDMFHEAGVDKVGLAAEGNHPAYDAVLAPYYHANIPANQKSEAFQWLEEEGHGDIIKTVIKVELGRGDRAIATAVEAVLEKMNVDYSSDLGVPWNTLTAWLKEQIEKHNKVPPLSLIGATVGNIVKLKERKK